MTFYSFHDIRERADCRTIAAELHRATIRDGRCAATWRGGDNPESVAIEHGKWYDHGTKTGGGAIELAALAFNGDTQRAQEWCGQRFNCEPKRKLSKAPASENCRHARLLSEGYEETARYEYRDPSGAVRHVTVRLQHPDRPGKEFVQGAPDGSGGFRWSLKGVDTILYRLPELAESPWVLICEGEKSANRLAALGLPTTTAPMGAGKWQEPYTASLAGKSVAIAPDNDAPGRAHADTVAAALHAAGIAVRIVGPLSSRPAGGIDDWLDEGETPRTVEDVLAAIQAAPQWHPPLSAEHDNGGAETSPDRLAEAKQANTEPFRNFIPTEVDIIRRGKPAKEITKEPRSARDLLRDLDRRLLGFPRRVGSMIFDHDRDSGTICHLPRPADLVAWIDRRTGKTVQWTRGDAFPTKEEFFAGVFATCRRYEAISYVPDWPRRPDVYYAHQPIPQPSPGRAVLEGMLDLFSPATNLDRHLIAALVAAPLWYIPGIPRPSWVIDSQDGAGSGKTVLVELVASLYGTDPVRTNPDELRYDVQELIKRLLSAEGRCARVVLIDNVSGEFRSPGLADLTTAKSISGRAPYGHGEEKRPNNCTFVMTANSAQVDNDLAVRSYYVSLRKPEYDPRWMSKIQSYVQANRLAIIADIIDALASHKPFPGTAPSTRFPEFEASVLQPMCGDVETYTEVVEHLSKSRAESNVEEEVAAVIRDAITSGLRTLGLADDEPVFIRSEALNAWCGRPIRDLITTKDRPIQIVRNLAKSRHLQEIDATVTRWPSSSRTIAPQRYRGLAWCFDFETEQAAVVSYTGEGKFSVSRI